MCFERQQWRCVRVVLVLWFLSSESHVGALSEKVMRIPIWKSIFCKLEKRHVQALRSAKMKPAWHRGKPQKANRKKKVKPQSHRRSFLPNFVPLFGRFFWTRVAPREASQSEFQASLQEVSFTELLASEAPELTTKNNRLLEASGFRRIRPSVAEVVASVAFQQPYAVDLSQQ